jgi:hypothetical protein
MNEFLAWISKILDSWKFWIVIPPWDVGVRIRFGKNATGLKPGIHFRIPFIDNITLVNTRLRIETTPPVNIDRANNKTRYISATIGYIVSDPLKSMMKFGRPETVVISKTQSEIATHKEENKVIKVLKEYFNNDSGIEIDFVKFIDDVEVKTYRLINGGSWIASGHESITSGQHNDRY